MEYSPDNPFGDLDLTHDESLEAERELGKNLEAYPNQWVCINESRQIIDSADTLAELMEGETEGGTVFYVQRHPFFGFHETV